MEMETEVKQIIEDRLKCFDAAIDASAVLEMAGRFYKGEEIPTGGGKQPSTITAQEDCFKIINHDLENAVLVSVDSVIRTPTKCLVEALESGVTTKLHGVTRIVGYYSRVSNWNSSKIGELADRRKGVYWEKPRVNSVKVGVLGEK